ANSLRGHGACFQPQIRESLILPFVLRLLGEEIADLTAVETLAAGSAAPDRLRSPRTPESARRDRTQKSGTSLPRRSPSRRRTCCGPRTTARSRRSTRASSPSRTGSTPSRRAGGPGEHGPLFAGGTRRTGELVPGFRRQGRCRPAEG